MHDDPAFRVFAWKLLPTIFFAGIFLVKKIRCSVMAMFRPACNNFQGNAAGHARALRSLSDIN